MYVCAVRVPRHCCRGGDAAKTANAPMYTTAAITIIRVHDRLAVGVEAEAAVFPGVEEVVGVLRLRIEK